MSIKVQGTTIINDQTAYIDFAPTNAVKVPTGALGERPSPVTGQMRFNTTDATLEGYYRTTWCPIGSFGVNLCLGPTIRASIFSTGANYSGNLGDGTTVDKCSFVRERCSATDWCTVAATHGIKKDGTLWTWGPASYGRLGDGTVTDKCSPVREISSSTNWCRIDLHRAIKTDGSLWAWGENRCGQIGDGTTASRCSPVRERCSDTNWCQVSRGGSSTSAVKTTGRIWGWGNNNNGRLGDGTNTVRCSPVREVSSSTDWCFTTSGCQHTHGIKTGGTLWSWGEGGNGRLGTGTITSRCSPVQEICSAVNWCAVTASYYSSSAIKTDGSLWSWGNGSAGNLGVGTTTTSCSPVREFYSATNWCHVAQLPGISESHRLAIKTDGTLWGWGQNGSGRLGDGSTINKCSPVREITSRTDWKLVSSGSSTTTAMALVTPF